MSTILVMPKPEPKTKPMSLRLDAALMRRLRAYGDRAEIPPTITSLIELAVTEFLDRRENAKQLRR
jgi:hypothetical protein